MGKNPRRAPSSWKMIPVPLALIDAAIPVSTPDRARGQIEDGWCRPSDR
jgi:hypothetical protein